MLKPLFKCLLVAMPFRPFPPIRRFAWIGALKTQGLSWAEYFYNWFFGAALVQTLGLRPKKIIQEFVDIDVCPDMEGEEVQ